jgi:hypothetical protein
MARKKNQDWNLCRSVYNGAILYTPVGHGLDPSDYDVVPNDLEIDAAMMVEKFEENKLVLKDLTNNHTHKMFTSDVIEMMKKASINKGVVTGRWGFTQRNEYTGLQFIK